MSMMNAKINTLLYAALFSGLGLFSFLLLVNHTNLSPALAESLYSIKTILIFIGTFNVLGYITLKVSTWIENQYSLNIHHRWKFTAFYIFISLIFLPLNYFLLALAKVLVSDTPLFILPNGGCLILIVVWLVELVILGLLLINRSMQTTLKLQQQTANLQKENNTARYTALQNQLNPHFLFNSLNTLISEIRYNPSNAELFTQHLSDVYRYTLRCQEKRLASLDSELQFMNSYIFLHQVRLGNCIHIDNQIDPTLWELKIPPLALQLLAENVIKHNTIHTGKPMTITLSYSEKERMLIMRNPIQPKKSVTPSGVGLKNLAARYQLLCNQTITIEKDNECFTVKFPLLNE